MKIRWILPCLVPTAIALAATLTIVAVDPPAKDAKWGPAVSSVDPGESRQRPRVSLERQCVERAEQLQWKLSEACHTAVHPPFVLAGNLSSDELTAKYTTLLRPATDFMTQRYFRRLPDRPITVLLFSNEATYRRYAEHLFFDRRVSRFGYYKPGRRTLLVNLAAGEGGLLHELTHALMDADCPDCAWWLREGLATLHEASRIEEVEGGVVLAPAHNWRLAVLRDELRAGRLGSVGELVTQATGRGEAEAVDYAHVRYFCLFLDQRGLLEPLYRRMRQAGGAGRCSEQAVLSLLPGSDWESLDAEFRAWLGLSLRRPSHAGPADNPA